MQSDFGLTLKHRLPRIRLPLEVPRREKQIVIDEAVAFRRNAGSSPE